MNEQIAFFARQGSTFKLGGMGTFTTSSNRESILTGKADPYGIGSQPNGVAARSYGDCDPTSVGKIIFPPRDRRFGLLDLPRNS